MKIKNVSNNLLTTSIAIIVCIVLIVTSFSSGAHSGSFDRDASSESVLVNHNKNQVTAQGSVSYPSNLSDHNNSADYLIITSDGPDNNFDNFYSDAKDDYDNGGTFDSRLNELAHWRAEYNGFDVAVVNVNDSFIGGNNDTYIKEFVEYVYNNWSAPHMSDNHVGYILFVGDTPFVTAHYVRYYDYHSNRWAYYVMERWYGCFGYNSDTGYYEGDDDRSTPDIMIGRFSVDNQTELNVIADKTIRYEQNYNYSAEDEDTYWHKKVLMVRGFLDEDLFSPGYDDTKEILLELGGWEVFEVFLWKYKEEYGGWEARRQALRSDIIDNITNGRSIVVYSGHGATRGWGAVNFSASDVNQLSNGYKLPLIYSLACSTGRFQTEEPFDCLGETFLNTPNKGAIAFWGASIDTGATTWFINYLFASIFEDFEYTIGKIVLEGIIKTGGSFPSYNLLGDPALDLSGSRGYPARDKPDLTLSHLNISISPGKPRPGDEVTINTTILNIGGSTAENVTVRFIAVNPYGDEHIVGEQIVSEILPGGQSVLIQLWNVSEEFCEESLIVQIDADNSIDEAFELNNQAGIKVAIFQDITYVDDDYGQTTSGWRATHFDNIRDGVYFVVENGTVYVFNGTYYENVVIDKSIHLIGEDKSDTIIDGSGSGTVVSISADRVNISGFTIQNSGSSGDAGIKVDFDYANITENLITNNNFGIMVSGSYNKITWNNITNNEYGIYMWKPSSYNNTISGNDITDNDYGIYLRRTSNNIIKRNNIITNDYGIYIWDASNNDIHGNSITNSNYSIYLKESSDNTIFKNTIANNEYHGIYLYQASNNIIKRNNITNNDYGIYLRESSDNTIFKNTIANSDIGIYLVYASNNIIKRNNITNNDYGISNWRASNNDIYENSITNSNYGIYLQRLSNFNLIYHNNFINNNQSAYDECSNTWYKGSLHQGNYWSDYAENIYPGLPADEQPPFSIWDIPYDIPPGSSNQDHYPLMIPYPSVDLAVTDFSAETLSGTPAHILPDLKLTAVIQNKGNVDITIPFRVAFYRDDEDISHDDAHFNSINSIIGIVEIPSIGAGGTINATIYWEPQPEIHVISVCADSGGIVEEINESNNRASITMSYLLWNSLKETVEVYRGLGQQYETQYAKEVAMLAKEALLAGLFTSPQEYIQGMKTIAEFEYKVGMDLEGQIPSLLLEEYKDTVEHLIKLIDELINDPISPDIWDDAEAVAEIQLQICEIVMQMLR